MGDPSNEVGFVRGSQLYVNGTFTTGDAALVSVVNSGTVTSSQLYFNDSVSLGSGSMVTVSNTGTVSDAQLCFNAAVDLGEGNMLSAMNLFGGAVSGDQVAFHDAVVTGSGIIQAANQGGIVGGHGIGFYGSDTSASNAGISLMGADLWLDSSLGSSFQIGNLAGDSTSTVVLNMPLQINTAPGSSTTFSGTISGSYALTISGSGHQSFSGENTYSGPITLDGGSFAANYFSTSPFSINFGAILKGTGTVGTLDLNNGAILAPGNSVGTLNSGSVTFHPGSHFRVEVDPTASSLLNVTGSAVLAGDVQIIQDPGSYARSGTYVILDTTTGITGAFDPTVTGGTQIGGHPGYLFSLAQSGNEILLSYTSQIPTTDLNGNRLKLANYLNEYASGSTIALFHDTTDSQLQGALNHISPSRNAFGTYITQQTAFSLSKTLSGHMNGLLTGNQSLLGGKSGSTAALENSSQEFLLVDASDRIRTPVKSKKERNKFSAWISGFGEYAHQKASGQNPSFNYFSEAVFGGVDFLGEKRCAAGTALGYAHSHFTEDHNFGHGKINYYFTSLYGNLFAGNFYFSPAVWGIFDEIANLRNIQFPGFSKKARANIFAWQLVPHLEVGYDAQFSWGDMIPFSALDWAITWQRGYQERGASPFNARVKAQNSSMMRSETGLRFCEKWQYSSVAFFLKEKISYVFEKPFGRGNLTSSLTGIPSAFTLSAINQTLNLADVGLDFAVALGEDSPTLINLGYEGEFGSQYWSNQLMVTVSKGF